MKVSINIGYLLHYLLASQVLSSEGIYFIYEGGYVEVYPILELAHHCGHRICRTVEDVARIVNFVKVESNFEEA